MVKSKKSSRLTFILAMLLLPAGYVLSYAPVYRMAPSWLYCGPDFDAIISLIRTGIPILDEARPGPYLRVRNTWMKDTCSPALRAFYRPVELLTDETFLREPLLTWGGLWGVRDDLEFDSSCRDPSR